MGNSPFELNLFGLVQISGGTHQSRAPLELTRKARALLVLVALSPDRRVDRSRLAGLLWSESEEARARQSLRQTLLPLRNLAEGDEPGLLQISTSAVALAPQTQVDVDAFLKGINAENRAEIEAGLAHYRGPLADGLDLGEPEFDQWLQTERQRLHAKAITGTERLIDLLRRNADGAKARLYAERLLALDPLREESHRIVLRLDAELSGRASAMARFNVLSKLLKDELGVEPEKQTRDVMAAIMAAGSIAPAASTPLVAETPPPPQGIPAAQAPAVRAKARGLLAVAVTTVLAAAVATGAVLLIQPVLNPVQPLSPAPERKGQISMIIPPFGLSSANTAGAEQLREGLVAAFTSYGRFSTFSSGDQQAPAGGYLLAIRLERDADTPTAKLALIDRSNGETIVARALPGDWDESRGQRRLLAILARSVYLEVMAHRAKVLTKVDGQEDEALYAQAEAATNRMVAGADTDEAAVLYERVIANNPGHFGALLGLARYHINRVATNRVVLRREDHLQQARDLLDRAREIDPRHGLVIFQQGMLDKLTGQFRQALENFRRSAELVSYWPSAGIQAAHVLVFLGRAEEAYPQLVDMVETYRDDFSINGAMFMLGETALLVGSDADAVRWLRASVQESPRVGRHHALLATALELTGEHAEAEHAARQAKKLAPHFNPDGVAQRGFGKADSRYEAQKARYVAAFRAVYSRID